MFRNNVRCIKIKGIVNNYILFLKIRSSIRYNNINKRMKRREGTAGRSPGHRESN